MKKWVVLVLMLALAGGILVGCDNGEAKETLTSAMNKSLTVQKMSGTGLFKLTAPETSLQLELEMAVDVPGKKANIGVNLNIDGNELTGRVIIDGDKVYIKTPYIPQYIFADGSAMGVDVNTEQQSLVPLTAVIDAIDKVIPNRHIKQSTTTLTVGGSELPVTLVEISGIDSDMLVQLGQEMVRGWLADPTMKQAMISLFQQQAAAAGASLSEAEAEQQFTATVDALDGSSIALHSFSYNNWINEAGNIVKTSMEIQDGADENSGTISMEFTLDKLNDDVTVDIPQISKDNTMDLMQFITLFQQAMANQPE